MDCEQVCTFLGSFWDQAFVSWLPSAIVWLALAGCLILPTWTVTRLQPLSSPKPPPTILCALWLCCHRKIKKLAQRLTSALQKNRSENTKLSEQLYFVAIDLIFPAILGTIIYAAVNESHAETKSQEQTLIILKIAIISHYCYDFIYIKKKYHKENYKYSVCGFFLDFFDAALTYCAANAVDLKQGTANLDQVGAAYFVTYLLFVLWDLTQNEHREAIHWDALFAIAFLVLSVIASAFHTGNSYAGPCEFFIMLALAATIFAGTMKFANTINQLKDD